MWTATRVVCTQIYPDQPPPTLVKVVATVPCPNCMLAMCSQNAIPRAVIFELDDNSKSLDRLRVKHRVCEQRVKHQQMNPGAILAYASYKNLKKKLTKEREFLLLIFFYNDNLFYSIEQPSQTHQNKSGTTRPIKARTSTRGLRLH